MNLFHGKYTEAAIAMNYKQLHKLQRDPWEKKL